MSVRSTVDSIVADILDLEEERINGSLSPEDTEYWDSMNHLRLVTAIEEEYTIRLTMDEVKSIICVNDIYEIVEKYTAEQ